MAQPQATVVAVARGGRHGVGKALVDSIELVAGLGGVGFDVGSGEMGENVTTRGVALLDLPRGTRLMLGLGAVLEITGLRNPCAQLDGIAPGLLAATLGRNPQGGLVRKAGVMAVVLSGGLVRPGDEIHVELPTQGPLEPLGPV
jgi:MOSC domain-containing protein YiiM